MAPERGYALSAEAVRKLRRVVARVEHVLKPREGRSVRGLTQVGSRRAVAPFGQWVQATSATQTGGRYPGQFGTDDESGADPGVITAQGSAGDVWVRAANGATMATGIWYWARLENETAAGVPVYVVDDGSTRLGGIEVKEADGSPDYTGVTTLIVDQASGLTLSQPGSGQAQISLTQTFAVGTAGTDFAVVHSGTTYTFNLPDASATARGVINASNQYLGSGIKSVDSLGVSPLNGNGTFAIWGTTVPSLQMVQTSDGGYGNSAELKYLNALGDYTGLVWHDPAAGFPGSVMLYAHDATSNGQPRYGCYRASDATNQYGITGTGGGGDTFLGGICTAAGSSSSTLTIGTTSISGGAGNGILYDTGAGKLQYIATGTADQVLRIPHAGGTAAFGAVDVSQAAAVTGLLAPSNGGTGLDTSASALGGTLYLSAAGTWSVLAGNTASTRKFLRSLGAAGVAAAPAWDTLTAADVPAMVASGGSHAAGLAPDPGSAAGTTRFLCEDATYRVPGSGVAGAWQCQKFTVPYTSFTSLTGTVNHVALGLTISAPALVLGVVLHHTVPFTGAGVTAAQANVGDLTNLVYTSASLLANFDVHQAATNTTLTKSPTGAMFVKDTLNSLAVQLELQCNVNLSNLTAGSVDVWVIYTALP